MIATIDPTKLARYRKHRAAGVPAMWAYRWVFATPDPLTEYNLDWGLNADGLPFASGIHGAYRVTVGVAADDDPSPRGRFTDTFQDGALRNPAWRGDRPGGVYRWWLPESGSTVDGIRAELAKAGAPRHDAWLRAHRMLLTELNADAEPCHYVVQARVWGGSVLLGESALYGIEFGDDGVHGDPYLREVTASVLSDALHDAAESRSTLPVSTRLAAAREAVRQALDGNGDLIAAAQSLLSATGPEAEL